MYEMKPGTCPHCGYGGMSVRELWLPDVFTFFCGNCKHSWKENTLGTRRWDQNGIFYCTQRRSMDRADDGRSVTQIEGDDDG